MNRGLIEISLAPDGTLREYCYISLLLMSYSRHQLNHYCLSGVSISVTVMHIIYIFYSITILYCNHIVWYIENLYSCLLKTWWL